MSAVGHSRSRRRCADGAPAVSAALRLDSLKVADLATNSPDFCVVRRTVLDRYDRLYRQHVTGGRLTYRRDASQRDLVAGTYTSIVLNHAQVATGALLRREGLYSSLLTTWRRQREAGALQEMRGRRRGPTPRPIDPRVKPLEAENRRLQRKLQRAETIITLQKKWPRSWGSP